MKFTDFPRILIVNSHETESPFRSENEEIPKIDNPAKLFRVERIRPVKGNPYWERKILRDLGLFDHDVSLMHIV